MGFSFETLQKVLTFAHTIAEIAQLVEHQLPKLRAAGSNPVFRSKANRMMPNGHHFFCARTGPLQTCLHKGLDGQQKRLCAAQRFAFWSPRGQRTGMPEAKSRLTPGIPKAKSRSGKNPGGTPTPPLVPAIHRGHLPPPEGPPARGTAHDGTNLLHRGHTPLLQPSPAKGTAHGELHELTNAINPLRNFLLYL